MTDFKDIVLPKPEADILLKMGIDCGKAVVLWVRNRYYHVLKHYGVHDIDNYCLISDKELNRWRNTPETWDNCWNRTKEQKGDVIPTYTSDQLFRGFPKWFGDDFHYILEEGYEVFSTGQKQYRAAKKLYELWKKYPNNWLLINFELHVYLKKEGLHD